MGHPDGRCGRRHWHPAHDLIRCRRRPAAVPLDIPRSGLDDPQDRLDRTRRPQALPATNWSYDVPTTALALFPAEPQIPLRRKAEHTENLVCRTEFGRGGHFAALEEPDLLVGDVRAFFRQLRAKG